VLDSTHLGLALTLSVTVLIAFAIFRSLFLSFSELYGIRKRRFAVALLLGCVLSNIVSPLVVIPLLQMVSYGVSFGASVV
jgi:hypothetical protein